MLVSGIGAAIAKSKAKKIYISNLMTKNGHTSGFAVKDFTDRVNAQVRNSLNYVVFNNRRPSPTLISRYAHKGEHPVDPAYGGSARITYLGADLVSKRIMKPKKGDPLSGQRSLIRHDSAKVARIIAGIVKKRRS